MTQPRDSGSTVTLLTDFGLSDTFVGTMKGVMLGINPHLSFVDLTHDVAPQNVLEGAFLLGTAWSYFPPGTIHLAVVDPGVGTGRRALVVRGHGHRFVVPDNGLLSFVLKGDGALGQRGEIPLPEGFHAFVLTDPRYWLPEVSATFHGRDVFAPVAAHLSLGVPLERLGEPVEKVTGLGIPLPYHESDRLVAHVLHTDRFGNMVTNAKAETLDRFGSDVEIEIGSARIRGLVRTYGQGEGLVALIGSHGYLEVAEVNGNAARRLGVSAGERISIHIGLQS